MEMPQGRERSQYTCISSSGQDKTVTSPGSGWRRVKLLLQNTASLLCSEDLCEGSFACVWPRRAETGVNRLLFAGVGIKVMEGMESLLVCDVAVLGLCRMLV